MAQNNMMMWIVVGILGFTIFNSTILSEQVPGEQVFVTTTGEEITESELERIYEQELNEPETDKPQIRPEPFDVIGGGGSVEDVPIESIESSSLVNYLNRSLGTSFDDSFIFFFIALNGAIFYFMFVKRRRSGFHSIDNFYDSSDDCEPKRKKLINKVQAIPEISQENLDSINKTFGHLAKEEKVDHSEHIKSFDTTETISR